MHIALVAGSIDQRTRGNYTTVRRWERTCVDCGVEVISADTTELERVPDLFHGYHAYHGGRAALRLARKYDRPFVVSIGGTDLFSFQDVVKEVYLAADAVTGAFPGFREIVEMRVQRAVPYHVVPRAAETEPTPPCRDKPGDELNVLLPAGLRPVKEPLLGLDLAVRLREAGVPLRFTIAGPDLDCGHAIQVRARAEALDFVTVTEYPPEEMRDVYCHTDVVWNTSVHEGGANALLEAVAQGCAIFARNVTGNRQLLSEPGAPGTLFDPDDFASVVAYHLALLRETEEERARRVERGHAWLQAMHSPGLEAAALARVWNTVLSS